MAIDQTLSQLDILDDWVKKQDDFDLFAKGERFEKVDTTGCFYGIYKWFIIKICGYTRVSGDENLNALGDKVSALVTNEFILKLNSRDSDKLSEIGAFVYNLQNRCAQVNEQNGKNRFAEIGRRIRAALLANVLILSAPQLNPSESLKPTQAWLYIRDSLMGQVPKYFTKVNEARLGLAIQGACGNKRVLNKKEAEVIFHDELSKYIPIVIKEVNERTMKRLEVVLAKNGIVPFFVGKIERAVDFSTNPEQFKQHVYEITKREGQGDIPDLLK